MPAEPGTRPESPVAAVVLTSLAGLLYLFMLWMAAAVPYLESIDKGVAAIYALIAVVLLWILLAGLLIVGAIKGDMPIWAATAAFIAHPLSAAAAVASLFLLAENYHAPYWPMLFLAVPPPLLAGYALWAHFPRLRLTLPATPISGAVMGILLVLSIGQLAYTINRHFQEQRQSREDRKAADQQFAREQEAKRQQNLARFQRLTSDSPLAEWREFIGKGNELEKQAVERARLLPHRQSDAEKLLAEGNGFPLYHIGELDLHATPEFCAGARDYLVNVAAKNRPASSDQKYALVAGEFESWLPQMRWMIGQHCDLDAAVTAMEAAVHSYPQSKEQNTFLASIARLHPEWRACRGDNGASLDQQITGCGLVIASATGDSEGRSIALFYRGGAWLTKGETDRAIHDYDEAIRTRPDFAEALNNRGNAYDDNAEHERAIQDYSEAIRIKPDFAAAFSNRGNAHEELAEHDLAIQDYNQAIRINANYQNALKNRGRARFFQGDFRGAAHDFAQALSLRPTDAYTVLWLHLARSRADPDGQEALRRDAAPLDRNAWPWPLVAAYLGEQDTATVHAAAHRGAAHERDDMVCDANFYLGERAVISGDAADAHDLLLRAENTCPANSLESYSARFELDRLRP